MSALHTAGPWIATPDGAVTTEGGAEIAHVFECKNVPVLAAAPELLAALIALDEAFCDDMSLRETRHKARLALIAARAAVAKATGVAP